MLMKFSILLLMSSLCFSGFLINAADKDAEVPLHKNPASSADATDGGSTEVAADADSSDNEDRPDVQIYSEKIEGLPWHIVTKTYQRHVTTRVKHLEAKERVLFGDAATDITISERLLAGQEGKNLANFLQKIEAAKRTQQQKLAADFLQELNNPAFTIEELGGVQCLTLKGNFGDVSWTSREEIREGSSLKILAQHLTNTAPKSASDLDLLNQQEVDLQASLKAIEKKASCHNCTDTTRSLSKEINDTAADAPGITVTPPSSPDSGDTLPKVVSKKDPVVVVTKSRNRKIFRRQGAPRAALTDKQRRNQWMAWALATGGVAVAAVVPVVKGLTTK